MNLQAGLYFLGYVALFGGSVAALWWWQRHQRKRRLPFADNQRLLRAPGETQLQRVRRLEEHLPFGLAAAASVPALAGLVLLGVATRLPPVLQVAGLAVALVGFVAAFGLAARWMAGRMRECGDRYLGYFGERLVAEHLEPLKAQGWRVFHDVPAENHGARFNLDHVAVGPGGVYAIETKTRRKGGARPGFDDHKVYFDGRDLVWPWGEDNHGLEQAERQALWLTTRIRTEVGVPADAVPVLVLPGWGVENKPARATRLCRVLNPELLPGALAQAPGVLAASQVESIAAWLEARCRDVGY